MSFSHARSEISLPLHRRGLPPLEGGLGLIEGIPYCRAPSPTFRQQRIALKIARQLDEALEDCPRCERSTRPTGSRLPIRSSSLMSWFSVIRWKEDYPAKPPRLIVEILSPVTKLKDEQLKREIYARFDVRHYFLVDPEEEKTIWLELEGDRHRERPILFRVTIGGFRAEGLLGQL